MPPPPSKQQQLPARPSPQYLRTNISDLKSQIAKQLGPDRAQRYFNYLKGLLSQKLSKPEFNKLCVLTLGRENLPLHNQLIRSILRNACQAKTPPLFDLHRGALQPSGIVLINSPRIDDRITSSQALPPAPPIFSNGNILPPSPRKSRTAVQNRRINDHPSSMGPNGRADVASHHSLIPYNEVVLRENGDLHDLKRPVQHLQGVQAEQSAKRSRTEKALTHDRGSVHSKGLAETVVTEDREDAEHWSDLESSIGPLQAPLGIPFCSASIGGARRTHLSTAGASCSSFSSSYGATELCHTELLKKQMEKIAEAQGLEGVAMDCADLLNKGIDAYLKRLIRSCVELVGARTVHEPLKEPVSKLRPCPKPINGVWVGNHIQMQNSVGLSRGTHELKNCFSITMQDFKVAMELKPQQLGEDWPLLLEKICVHSFEE